MKAPTVEDLIINNLVNYFVEQGGDLTPQRVEDAYKEVLGGCDITLDETAIITEVMRKWAVKTGKKHPAMQKFVVVFSRDLSWDNTEALIVEAKNASSVSTALQEILEKKGSVTHLQALEIITHKWYFITNTQEVDATVIEQEI